MSSYYLRMEAVNQLDQIYDTANLSVVRGTGLAMRSAVHAVRDRFQNELTIETEGASIGVFRFKADDAKSAEKRRKQVATFLREEGPLCHLTFVVDVQEQGEDDDAVLLEKLTARNRWRQWVQPVLVVPQLKSTEAKSICGLDGLRPAARVENVQKRSQPVSDSCWDRYKYGRDQKKEFYGSETPGARLPDDFVFDFETLSKIDRNNYAKDTRGLEDAANLDGKMAVIYLDGNSFTRIRKDTCPTFPDLKAFGDEVKRQQRTALKALLSRFSESPLLKAEKAARLETLLWGGDELIWVVPGWYGWRALEEFFENIGGGEFRGTPLTYCGGLVFCHHHAPIRRVVDLARNLADSAKELNKERHGDDVGRYQNLFQYLVLESYDHIGLDLDDFRTRRGELQWQATLEGDGMATARTTVLGLKETEKIAHRQVIRAVHALLGSPHASQSWEDWQIRFEQITSSEIFHELANLEIDFFGDKPGFWLHLAELWDYLNRIE